MRGGCQPVIHEGQPETYLRGKFRGAASPWPARPRTSWIVVAVFVVIAQSEDAMPAPGMKWMLMQYLIGEALTKIVKSVEWLSDLSAFKTCAVYDGYDDGYRMRFQDSRPLTAVTCMLGRPPSCSVLEDAAWCGCSLWGKTFPG